MSKKAGWLNILVIVAAVITASAQTTSDPDVFLDSGSSFKLESGSSFSASNSGPTRPKPPTATARRNALADDLAEAIAILEKNHAFGKKIKPEKLTEHSVRGMLRSLDPHSQYFNAGRFAEMMNNYEGEYSGVGISITDHSFKGKPATYVVAVTDDSPAAYGGIEFGDRIVAIDGHVIDGKDSVFVRDLIRGKNGTSVKITVEKADGDVRRTYEITRRPIARSTITNAFLIRDEVGYIGLRDGFAFATYTEFTDVLDQLKRRGADSLLLDLRGNSGGILDQAVKIAGHFLPNGSVIVSQRGRTPNDSFVHRAQNITQEKMPLVILVDRISASASEVLAGALQDNDRALIVGERTFGKGLVQNILELPDGAGLTLTAAEYFTPSGRSIQRDYSDGSLYDYYNHKNTIAEIDRPMYAARTITNRTVYGGNGIAPDTTVAYEEFTERRLSLLDPMFFFIRDGKSTANFESFREYAMSEWHISAADIDHEAAYISRQLEYLSALGSYGQEAAGETALMSDPQVEAAIANLSASAELAKKARRALLSAKK